MSDESNLANFLKCKDLNEDKASIEQKIQTKEECLNYGSKAMTEIKGSQFETALTVALETSIVRVKSEVKVLKAFQDPKVNPSEIVQKYAIPQRLVAEKEKQLWNEIKIKTSKTEESSALQSMASKDWIFNLILGIVILFGLHYLNNKEKIDEKVKYNNKNNKK